MAQVNPRDSGALLRRLAEQVETLSGNRPRNQGAAAVTHAQLEGILARLAEAIAQKGRNVADAPTHDTDAAAGAAGLKSGDIYKTSTGALRAKL